MDGFTAAELGAKVGVSARTVRYYTAQHVLPSPQFRGSATRYLREHLIHLAAIRYLQHERRKSLAAIRAYLAPLTAAELERLAAFVLPELAPTPVASPVSRPCELAVPSVTDAWVRHLLVPGVELHVHVAVSAQVREQAYAIAQSMRGAQS